MTGNIRLTGKYQVMPNMPPEMYAVLNADKLPPALLHEVAS